MTDWTEMERGSLINFLSVEGPLKSALLKFINTKAENQRSLCAMHMATVPRNPEAAADHAAKAQLLSEFWASLTEDVLSAELPQQTEQVL